MSAVHNSHNFKIAKASNPYAEMNNSMNSQLTDQFISRYQPTRVQSVINPYNIPQLAMNDALSNEYSGFYELPDQMSRSEARKLRREQLKFENCVYLNPNYDFKKSRFVYN